MSESKSSAKSGGLGLCSVLTVVFVALKLLGVAPVATWSWVWVLSPLWIGGAIGFAFFVLFVLFVLVFGRLGCNR